MEGTAGRDHELKAQGAIDAAKEGAVDPQQAEKALAQHARAAGAAAFEFDPNASPEEKAAQAKEVRHFMWVSFGVRH